VVNTGTATLIGQLTAPGGALMNQAFFSPDGNYVGAASTKSDYYVFNAGTRKLVREFSVPGAQVSPVSFSPTDRTLYTLVTFSNGTNEMLSQDIATGKTVSHFDLPPGTKPLNQSTTDGSVIDSVAADGTVTEYEMASGKVLATVKNPGSAPVANVWPDADGHALGQHLVDAGGQLRPDRGQRRHRNVHVRVEPRQGIAGAERGPRPAG
jgi:WD40 repeat protein